ncbi:MAG: hypothetical protein H6600_08060 [Flavobacteriales bacterium]|nr:hypothetical protein [Flavobacteriales bacterium]MCB9198397.1 hypothetical protein [Flavobacteriales bacterium]
MQRWFFLICFFSGLYSFGQINGESCPSYIGFRDLGQNKEYSIPLIDLSYRMSFSSAFGNNIEGVVYPISIFSDHQMPFDIGLGGGISLADPTSYGYGKLYLSRIITTRYISTYAFGIGGYSDFFFGNHHQRFGFDLINRFKLTNHINAKLLVGGVYENLSENWYLNLGISLGIDNYIRPRILHRKPVVYVYTEDTTDVEIKLNYNGELTFVYPEFMEHWDLTVYPDGMIQDNSTNRKYPYLFWEGIYSPSQLSDLDSGFVVKKDSLVAFLEENLFTIGLNEREITDFITYWCPILEEEQYIIKFYQQDMCNSLATYNITPSPQSSIRLYVTFQPLNGSSNIPKPKLNSITREAFTIVEWGGMILPSNYAID